MSKAANFEDIVKDFARKKTVEIEKIVKEKFGLSDKFTIKLSLNYSPNRYRSRGGLKWIRKPSGNVLTPFMNLALYRCCNGVFHEYKSFAKDSEIGAIENCSWKKWITTLIVHEVSHVVQFSLMKPNQFARNGSSYQGVQNIPHSTTGHDYLWKTIYRTLRKELVNGVEFEDDDAVAAKPEPELKEESLKKVIGKVKIVDGSYRNKRVEGMFDLVRKYKPRAGSNIEGTVSILHKGKVFRVRVTPDNIKCVIKGD